VLWQAVREANAKVEEEKAEREELEKIVEEQIS